MSYLDILILFSATSFLIYGIAYFVSTNMKNEFKRFGLEKFGPLTAFLELVGAIGLFIGFGIKNNTILLLASGGLALLMLLGTGVRIKMKDSLLISLPAFFYFVLNTYILYRTLM